MWNEGLRGVLTGIFIALLLIVLSVGVPIVFSIYFPDFGVPPIARELSAKGGNPEEVFSERVSAAFPVGMPEDKAIEFLDEQGFTVYSDARTAEYSKAYIGCEARWSIKWQVDDASRLLSVKAWYGGACM